MSEFRAFLVKQNLIALAIAFILGVAFAAVVDSLVKDIIMPPVGMLLGRVDFSNLYINLSGGSYASLADAQKAGCPNTVTPFNGEHHAGPLAFISLPDATTNLGPLCANPDTSKTPVACNP